MLKRSCCQSYNDRMIDICSWWIDCAGLSINCVGMIKMMCAAHLEKCIFLNRPDNFVIISQWACACVFYIKPIVASTMRRLFLFDIVLFFTIKILILSLVSVCNTANMCVLSFSRSLRFDQVHTVCMSSCHRFSKLQ